jgi:Flp pilus assembly protein TadG
MRHSARNRLKCFAAAREGAGAVEFAFVAPVLIALLCGGFELTRYIKAVRQLTAASTAVAGMIAQNTSGSVNDTDLLFFRDAIMIAYPDVLADAAAQKLTWTNDIKVTMSSINFSQTDPNCKSNCTYQAKVAWSGGSNKRPCSTLLAPTSDTAQPSTTTLPSDTFGPGTLIVVDISFNYRPIVATQLLQPLPLSRSFYIQPRYVSSIAYSPNGTNFASTCPTS